MKKFILGMAGTFFALIFLFAFLLVLIDPYCVLHKPWFGLELVGTNNAHYIARGLIRNLDYNIVVCGSSMCENMHTDYIDSVFSGSKSIKVVQHGSYSKDLQASLSAAAQAGKADMMIMALDTAIWRKPGNSYRIEELPDYTVEKPTLFNIAPYVLNSSNFYTAASVFMDNLNGNVVRMNDWWVFGDEHYSEEAVYAAYHEVLHNGYGIADFNEENAQANLENIKEGVKACADKGIAVKFFIPPYCVADFAFSNDASHLDHYKKIWGELLEYDNVDIFAVQFDVDIISDLSLYRNTGHYNGNVSDRIIDHIAAGRYKLTKDNLDLEVEKFRKWLERYDWETLRLDSALRTEDGGT